MKRSQSRREFIQAAAAALAAAALPSALAGIPDRSTSLLVVKLMNFVPDPAAAAAFGKSYLAVAPGESEPAKLATLICGANVDVFMKASTPERRRMMDQRRQDDYANGDVVELLGWTMPRTEARLYALAFLR